MKKVLGLSLSALMIMGLAGCGSSVDSDTKTYNHFYTSDVKTMDYTLSQYATDHEINANFVDGLLEADNYGHLKGALAEEWSHNDDYTEWTFKLREGVKWVQADGSEYADLTAQDFVTGLQHAAEFGSGTLWLVQDVITNMNNYLDGKTKKDGSPYTFEDVGVKALDDRTVVYSFNQSVPYFESMTTYSILFPINEEFLNSKGSGCKLGAPDKNACEFGVVNPNNILYNGGYLLQTMDSKSQIVLNKNASYWDAENVFIESVKLIYTDGKDNTQIRKAFEDGTAESFAINASWADYKDQVEKYKDNITTGPDNASWFGINFNFNRQTYDGSVHTTDEDKANTKAAIQNTNFRLALNAAFDRVKYIAITIPEEVAALNIRNINNVPSIVKTSDGTKYGDLVTAAYQKLTGTDISLEDEKDVFHNPDKAMEYIEAAKKEGIKFPITLEMPTLDGNQRLMDKATSMADSVKQATDGNIIIKPVLLAEDALYATTYYLTDPIAANYDINSFSGWSPDYDDPSNGLGIYNNVNGAYLVTTGLYPHGTNKDSDAVSAKVGWDKFNELYFDACEIGTDLDARYKAFADAEAYLIANALYIPSTMDEVRTFTVTRVVPFTKPTSISGISTYKYKGMQLQNDPVTAEQYQAAYDDWQSKR